uniref:Uncharacterized protein n=1 Tax=Scytodes thoracica TaxID=1112478 RepID=A0A0A0V642_SCYTH|nr:hypothetical protein [Scytodes thoracica]
MDDTVVNISTEVSDSSIKEVPVSSDIIDNCHSDQTDLHPSEDNHSTLDNSNDVTHSTSDASNPALDSLFDSTAAQVPLAS